MSLLFLESFDDDLADLKWSSISRSNEIALGSGRTLRGWPFSDNNYDAILDLPAAEEHATITVGFAWRWLTLPTIARDLLIFAGIGGTNNHLHLRAEVNGALSVVRSPAVILGTTDVIFSADSVWRYVELSVTIDDAVGAAELRVDGATVLNLSGVDTRNGGADALVDRVRWQGATSQPATNLDDIYITNGAGVAPYDGFLGDLRIDVLFPDGNGATSDFVGSDADSVDNYLLVDETPHDGDTTYVESSTDGHIDLYTFDDLALAVGVLRGVIARAAARNTGAADNGRVLTRIAAVNYNGGDHALAASYDDAPRHVWQVSPATGVHWTLAELNAAEFGIENRP